MLVSKNTGKESNAQLWQKFLLWRILQPKNWAESRRNEVMQSPEVSLVRQQLPAGLDRVLLTGCHGHDIWTQEHLDAAGWLISNLDVHVHLRVWPGLFRRRLSLGIKASVRGNCLPSHTEVNIISCKKTHSEHTAKWAGWNTRLTGRILVLTELQEAGAVITVLSYICSDHRARHHLPQPHP